MELQRRELDNGDDAFTFVTGGYTVLNKPESYTYQFARQNRYLALDLHRLECPIAGYDYLVIKGDTEGFGVVNIILSAHDPDEEKKKSFISLALFKLKNGFQRPPAGCLFFSVSAEDEHGAKDWQEVRVLVDRPLDMKVLLNMDYNFWSDEENKLKSYAEIFALQENLMWFPQKIRYF